MVRTAAIFSDNMVLQRNKKIRVFGWGDEGSEITVTLLGKTARADCFQGRWTAYLPELPAAEGAVMEITDGTESIRFSNIAVGEVWLAGGQSNMELELKDALGGKEILKDKDNPNLKKVRFYYTPKVAYECEALYEEERKSHWELFNEKDGAKWSAVGVFFAERLAAKLNVVIGIVGCNWGGTSGSCWMSRERLLAGEATRGYVEEYEASDCIKKPEAEQIKEYEEYQAYQADWDLKAADIYAEEPMIPFDEIQKRIGECKYPGPMNCANFTRPSGLYETMIRRIIPYTLKGFLYYQGESDEQKPDSYYALLTGLIEQWREDFEDSSLPFIIVQLPMHRYQHEPDTKSWCLIREAQMKAYETIKNTGIAVVIDCGQFHEIHPKNKKPVGERLALQALCGVYHVIPEKEAFGPVYKDFLYERKDGNGMEISFLHAEEGFIVKNHGAGFELAGEDNIFYPAKAVFDDTENTVFLRAEKVKKPVKARYLWTNYGEPTVFGKNGLPLAPFRTHER